MENPIVKLVDTSNSIVSNDTQINFAFIDGKPVIIHDKELMGALDRALDYAKNYEFTGEESERKEVKVSLAQVRKANKSLSAEAKAFKKQYMENLFADFDAVLQHTDATMSEIIELLDSRTKQADLEFKNERKELLLSLLESQKVIYDVLENVDVSSFIDNDCLLRSITEKKARELVTSRVERFEKAHKLNLTPKWEAQELLDAFACNSWDATDVLSAYQEEMEARERELALVKQREQEKQERLAYENSHTILRISVANEHLDELRNFLKQIEAEEL